MRTTLFLFFIYSLGVWTLSAQQTYTVTWMMGISEEDASVTAAPGDTIKWVWGEDNMPHDVSSTDPNAPPDFGSEIMTGIGSEYEYTFTEEAVFDYGCSVHPDMVGVITIEALSIEEKFIKNLKLYPNPAASEIFITSLVPIETYQIYNLEGKQISTYQPQDGQMMALRVDHLESGLYFIRLVSENSTIVKKLIIN